MRLFVGYTAVTMKEQEVRVPREAQLTSKAVSPRLEQGTIFMADNTAVETQPSAPVVKAPEASAPSAFEQTRDKWYQKFSSEGANINDPHFRSVIRLLAERGIGPDGFDSSIDKKTVGRIVREMKEKKDDPRVLANAAIVSNDERKVKVQEFFQRNFNKPLTPNQLDAVIEAHNVGLKPDGTMEEGRDGTPASVYNYTDVQLGRKLTFLKNAGLSSEESRALIEEGYAGAIVAPPDREEVRDEESGEVVQEARREREHGEVFRQRLAGTSLDGLARETISLWDSGNLSEEQIEALLTDSRAVPGVEIAEKEAFNEMLKQAREAIRKEEEGIVKRHERSSGDRVTYFKLKQRDFEQLDQNVELWLNNKFDTLYAASYGRDPAQSPVLGEIEAAYGEAVRYLDKGRDREAEAEKVRILGDLFESRIRLMTMNSAISSKSIESIQKGSYGLRAHGLLAGYDLDNGYTGAVANRMAELLEDERLKDERGHMSPELANKIQDMLIEECVRLSGSNGHRGIGIHAGKSREDIVRAVRSAYDIVIDTQRMHILASRGQSLFGTDAYYSDAGAAFKAFNPKTFVSEKWGLFTPTDQRFTREVMEKNLIDQWLLDKKKDYPTMHLNEEQKKELGDILFKTIASPPDFFSSSWRIKGMKDQLYNLFAYKEAERVALQQGRTIEDIQTMTMADWNQVKKDSNIASMEEIEKRARKFGLFIRLKSASDKEKPMVWDSIVSYRPEEIIRLLREKYSENEMREVNASVFGNASYIDENNQTVSIAGYDEFKAQFGPSIRAIREHYLTKDNPEQIDFGNLTAEQRTYIDEQIGAGERQFIERTFQSMQHYIKRNNVVYVESNGIKIAKGSVIDKDYRFTDVYNKTLVTDDILLAKLEMLTKPQLNAGMRKLSDLWSSDLGGDGYVRNMNDLAAGHRYTDELLGFIRATETEEKLKHSQAAASAAADYDGRAGMAKVLRYTVVPYMESAMPPDVMDILGIDKLPARLKMTKLEDIYGPHAHPLSQEKRREEFDKIEALLESSVQAEIDSYLDEINKVNSDEELSVIEKAERVTKLKEKIKHAHHEGHKLKEQAEKVLKIRGRDLAYQKIAEVSFYAFVLFVLGESFIVASSAAKASGLDGGGHH